MYRWMVRQIDRFHDGYNYSMSVYDYKCSVLGLSGTLSLLKLRLFIEVIHRVFVKRLRIFCYPETPEKYFVVFKILLFLGYRISGDSSKFSHLALKWRNASDGNPYLPPEPVFQELTKSWPSTKFLNMHCDDVSKERVSAVFEETFGYTVSIDPLLYQGKCVMKSNWNGMHIGEVIECPITMRRPDFVYEKLIDNEVEECLVEDVRVPIFGGAIPFVYLKYRPLDSRLVDREHSNRNVIIAEVHERLSSEEVEKILKFCRNLGLDYGEIDVLRDRKDQRIYIVDVNNNPCSPSPISDGDAQAAIVRLATTFERTFAI